MKSTSESARYISGDAPRDDMTFLDCATIFFEKLVTLRTKGVLKILTSDKNPNYAPRSEFELAFGQLSRDVRKIYADVRAFSVYSGWTKNRQFFHTIYVADTTFVTLFATKSVVPREGGPDPVEACRVLTTPESLAEVLLCFEDVPNEPKYHLQRMMSNLKDQVETLIDELISTPQLLRDGMKEWNESIKRIDETF